MKFFQKSFLFAMPRCVLVLRGGAKPAALGSDKREEVYSEDTDYKRIQSFRYGRAYQCVGAPFLRF